MASASLQRSDLILESDLHPLCPSPPYVESLVAADSGLSAAQKAELTTHCLVRSCVFGDIAALTFLLTDPTTQAYVDLGIQEEDGTGLVSLTIQGFGAESDRDVDREECVRLLISHGADASSVDHAGWTALHYAALLAPPTLISYLMTHGCSLFSVTRRNLTAFELVTAHSTIPGREDVALLLEEAMRGEGWSGGKKEEMRRLSDERTKRRGDEKTIHEYINKALDVDPDWWGEEDSDAESSCSESEDNDKGVVFTPPTDYMTMLAYSPTSLPEIFDSLITNFPPTIRNAEPANALYMLVRFACLTCDHTWLEDLIIGATDTIEETFFSRADDIASLIFWLYNTTLWLHLMECDESIREACEILGSFEMIEEIINSLFVFIIRFTERKVDQLLNSCLLDHSSEDSDLDSIKFESDWSFLRPFSSKKKTTPSVTPAVSSSPLRTPTPGTPNIQAPSSLPSSPSRGFSSSIRDKLARTRTPSSLATLQALFADGSTSSSPSPADIIAFLTALHTLLNFSEINPVLTTQLWSQVMYWTSCEMFNRILTRKKYLCRSRAMQINMNLGVLEEWIGEMGLPRGVESHFAPVHALLNWLQCLSSITDFSNLVAMIQGMKCLNPMQMRRAVRDYKYEVNEGKMTDECVQYLTQLQKDWERHRVKLGVKALRQEMVERERDREGSVSPMEDGSSAPPVSNKRDSGIESSAAQQSIDKLFEKSSQPIVWEPSKPPEVLGELMDSRYMLPLLFPSDPCLLSASPRKLWTSKNNPRVSTQFNTHGRSASRSERRRIMDWRSRNRKIREVGKDVLQWVDGMKSASRWGKPIPLEDSDGESTASSGHGSDLSPQDTEDHFAGGAHIHAAPLTRKPSTRSRGRQSLDTVLDHV